MTEDGCVGDDGGWCEACDDCHGGYAACEDGYCDYCWGESE